MKNREEVEQRLRETQAAVTGSAKKLDAVDVALRAAVHVLTWVLEASTSDPDLPLAPTAKNIAFVPRKRLREAEDDPIGVPNWMDPRTGEIRRRRVAPSTSETRIRIEIQIGDGESRRRAGEMTIAEDEWLAFLKMINPNAKPEEAIFIYLPDPNNLVERRLVRTETIERFAKLDFDDE